MRPREMDGCFEAARCGRRQTRCAAPLRGLQLHENRAEPLRQHVVNVARDGVALFEHRLTSRFTQTLIDKSAVVQRQRRLARRGVEQRMAPAPLAV